MKTILLATTAILALTPAYAGGSSRAGSGAVAISNNVNVNHNQNLNVNRNTNINRNSAVGTGVGISIVNVKVGGGGGVSAPGPMSFAPLPLNQVSGVNYFQGSAPGSASAFIAPGPFTPAQSGYGNPGAEVMFGHLQKTEHGWTYEETQDVGGASRTFTPRVASKEK